MKDLNYKRVQLLLSHQSRCCLLLNNWDITLRHTDRLEETLTLCQDVWVTRLSNLILNSLMCQKHAEEELCICSPCEVHAQWTGRVYTAKLWHRRYIVHVSWRQQGRKQKEQVGGWQGCLGHKVNADNMKVLPSTVCNVNCCLFACCRKF